MPEWSFSSAWADGIGFVVFDPSQPNAHNRLGAPAELFITPSEQAWRERQASMARGRLR
jgi:hypothetical protein